MWRRPIREASGIQFLLCIIVLAFMVRSELQKISKQNMLLASRSVASREASSATGKSPYCGGVFLKRVTYVCSLIACSIRANWVNLCMKFVSQVYGLRLLHIAWSEASIDEPRTRIFLNSCTCLTFIWRTNYIKALRLPLVLSFFLVRWKKVLALTWDIVRNATYVYKDNSRTLVRSTI